MCKYFCISITAPLPGWRRFTNLVTGDFLDFDPDNADHAILLQHYERRGDYIELPPPAPCDVER